MSFWVFGRLFFAAFDNASICGAVKVGFGLVCGVWCGAVQCGLVFCGGVWCVCVVIV